MTQSFREKFYLGETQLQGSTDIEFTLRLVFSSVELLLAQENHAFVFLLNLASSITFWPL